MQSQEVSAEPEGGVVERLGGAVQIVRADQADESITQVVSLQKNKDNKNDHDASRGQRGQKRRHNAAENLDRARRGLVHLDLHAVRAVGRCRDHGLLRSRPGRGG